MNLILKTNDHLNSVYVDQLSGQPLYRTETPYKFIGSRTTTVKKLLPDYDVGHMGVLEPSSRYGFLAHLEFAPRKPSKIHYDGKEIDVSRFFRVPKVRMWSWARDRKFVGPDGQVYRWILGFECPSLVLEENQGALVARFRAKRSGLFHDSRDACLEITPLGLHMKDLIFLTFIYIKKIQDEKEASCNV